MLEVNVKKGRNSKEFAKFIADEIFSLSQDNLEKQGKIDTGELLGNARVEFYKDGARIIYAAKHAEPVEYGRDPGKGVPIDPLAEWARRKFNVSQKEARRIAFAVSNKIKKEGIKPARYMRDAVDEIRSKYGV